MRSETLAIILLFIDIGQVICVGVMSWVLALYINNNQKPRKGWKQ